MADQLKFVPVMRDLGCRCDWCSKPSDYKVEVGMVRIWACSWCWRGVAEQQQGERIVAMSERVASGTRPEAFGYRFVGR